MPCPFCGHMLLPCPFCGCDPHIHYYSTTVLLGCEADECSVNPVSSGKTLLLAVEGWNKRAPVAKESAA